MKTLLTISLIVLMAVPALAERDMSGSYAEIIGPDVANPGDTVTFEFNVCNGSPDAEWTTEVRFTFPETFHITDGWFDDGGAGWSFDFSTSGDYDETAHFLDGDDGYGEIQGGQCGTFYVTLDISPNTNCGPLNIHWKQYGDEWGDNPHWIGGDLPYVLCVTPVEDNNFSSVKSLY